MTPAQHILKTIRNVPIKISFEVLRFFLTEFTPLNVVLKLDNPPSPLLQLPHNKFSEKFKNLPIKNQFWAELLNLQIWVT